MSLLSIASPAQHVTMMGRARSTLSYAWHSNRTLTLAILLNLALIPVSLAFAVFDPVTITGVNGWIKPFKFAVSISVYTATFLWFLTYVQRGKFWVWLVATLTGALLIGENVLITMQVLRETTSHFNQATPFDMAVYNAMGGMIMLAAVANLVVAIWLLFERMTDRVLLTGLRWGVWTTLVGMLVTYLMIMPTPGQQMERDAARVPTIEGAHSVGVEDGGPGLPILGWSTTGGDLRVGHFIGLHAMQVLPLVAWLFNSSRAKTHWSMAQRVWLLRVFGAFYLAIVGLTTWQAVRGQPLIYPDLLTVGVFLVIVGASIGAAFWFGRTPRHVTSAAAIS